MSFLPILLLAAGPALGTSDPILDALDAELDRTMAVYSEREDPPYFLSYRVADATVVAVSARYGALAHSSETRHRDLGVSARVGDYQLDNTRPLRGTDWDFDRTSFSWAALPVDAEVAALRSIVWRYTDRAIRDAQERIVEVRANRAVQVEETDPSADFSRQDPVVHLGPVATLDMDRAYWEKVVADLSRPLDANPVVVDSAVYLDAHATTQYIVGSEGTRIREPRTWVRISMEASTVADDGMELSLYRWKDVGSPDNLPSPEELWAWADGIVEDLVALRAAPRGEPYSGPVLLRGRAAGVFVHEVLGHRVEGHRQKEEDEGQTFKDAIGRSILPASISVYDDPGLSRYAGHDLNGHYRFDEEGQPGRRASLVEDGRFTGFLMSRSPIEGFPVSNGHGRAALYARPVARMANTVLETTDPRPYPELRQMLIEEAERQGKEYGLVIDEIGGGFTLTGRVLPNAFHVNATTAWRVFTDGRPDELIRGIDLVGTPLVALGSVVAAGDDPGVFNGFCGAESGPVPNSAVSPTLFLRELEVQRKEKEQDRPPLLQRPRPVGDR